MKKIACFLLFVIVFMSSCSTFSEKRSQPSFHRIDDISEGKCVVYLYRLPALVGAATTSNVRVFEAGENLFPEPDRKVYAWLEQKGYVPIVLNADTIYEIHGAGGFIFKGESGTEILLRAKGWNYDFECIAGSCYAYHGYSLTDEEETALIKTGENLEFYEAVNSSGFLEEISKTRLSSYITPYIQ